MCKRNKHAIINYLPAHAAITATNNITFSILFSITNEVLRTPVLVHQELRSARNTESIGVEIRHDIRQRTT